MKIIYFSLKCLRIIYVYFIMLLKSIIHAVHSKTRYQVFNRNFHSCEICLTIDHGAFQQSHNEANFSEIAIGDKVWKYEEN